jgi:hypothetical protein
MDKALTQPLPRSSAPLPAYSLSPVGTPPNPVSHLSAPTPLVASVDIRPGQGGAQCPCGLQGDTSLPSCPTVSVDELDVSTPGPPSQLGPMHEPDSSCSSTLVPASTASTLVPPRAPPGRRPTIAAR